jgi:hypothetical protein
LNEIFQTKFEVLNRKERIGQTTKGIWMAVDPKLRIVILDVEGSDSKERQETRTVIISIFRKLKDVILCLH